MKHRFAPIGLALLLIFLPGCSRDRENPTPDTQADKLMEAYLGSVQKIGTLLAGVDNKQEAEAVSAEVLLVVEDMRELIPRMKALSDKEQADTMSKYRVKINKVNEQFAKDVTHFVEIPGASEDLIEKLKNLPSFGMP